MRRESQSDVIGEFAAALGPDVENKDADSSDSDVSCSTVANSQLEDGPTTLEGVLSVVKDRISDIVSKMEPAMAEELRGFLQQDIVLTSVFSGAGTFEIAAVHAVKWLKSSLNVTGGSVICYASTELSPIAHQVLAAHLPATRPKHRFGDILERLYPTDRKHLVDLLGQILDKWKNTQEEYKLGNITKAYMMHDKARLAEEVKSTLLPKFEKVELREKMWCDACEQECFVSPRKEFGDVFWVDGGGTICCPWTCFGPCTGWLDWATLPTLVWAYSTRYFEPNTALHEITPAFPSGVVESILCVYDKDMLKSIYTGCSGGSSGSSADEQQRCYRPIVQVFSPVDLAIPSSRSRKYSGYHLAGAKVEHSRWHVVWRLLFQAFDGVWGHVLGVSS